jgi:hypothetical protein
MRDTDALFVPNKQVSEVLGTAITNDLFLHFAMSDPSQSQTGQPRDEKPKIVFQVMFQGRSESSSLPILRLSSTDFDCVLQGIKFQQKRATTLRRSLDEAAVSIDSWAFIYTSYSLLETTEHGTRSVASIRYTVKHYAKISLLSQHHYASHLMDWLSEGKRRRKLYVWHYLGFVEDVADWKSNTGTTAWDATGG